MLRAIPNAMRDSPNTHELELPEACAQTHVVIAAYNEGRAIRSVVEELKDTFRRVLAVDDGSTDDTLEAAHAAGATVLRHRVNLGQGAALQTGITYALRHGARYVATFDADGQHRVADLRRMIERLEGGDKQVVLGSRFLEDSKSVPPSRRILLRAAVVFTRVMTGLAVTDAHNGLRVFTAEAAEAIQIKNNRMAHASEILDQIARLGLRFCEFPVNVRYTSYSLRKGQRASASFRILLDYVLTRVFD